MVAIMGIAGEAHALQSIVRLMGEICLPWELGTTDSPDNNLARETENIKTKGNLDGPK